MAVTGVEVLARAIIRGSGRDPARDHQAGTGKGAGNNGDRHSTKRAHVAASSSGPDRSAGTVFLDGGLGAPLTGVIVRACTDDDSASASKLLVSSRACPAESVPEVPHAPPGSARRPPREARRLDP
jgi:hypothetical protein